MQSLVAKLKRLGISLSGGDMIGRLPVRRVQKWIWAITRTVLMCGLSFVILYPLLYMLSMVFRPLDQMADPSVVWIPKSLTLDNIKRAIDYMSFETTLPFTAIVTLGGTLLQMASAALAGYGMSRTKFRGQGILFALLLLSIVVPPQNIIIPLFRQYRNFDFFGLGWLAAPFNDGLPFTVSLIDKPAAMLLPALFANGIRSGLVIYIYMQFFKGLPGELEDAAYVDGCGSLKTFLYIILPNMTPVLVTIFTFSIVWYWTDYFYASMLTPRFSLSTVLSSIGNQIAYDTQTSNPYESIVVTQAGCLLFILPLLLAYLFLQRFFVQSIERTGITG